MSEELVHHADTMLYRAPTDESDEKAVQDIWGTKLETRVVDEADVPALLAQGWYAHPLEVGSKKKPEEQAGYEPVKGAKDEALEKAEALIAELATANKEAIEKVKAAEALATEATEANKKLTDDLKAAEQLVEAESKAKEAALAEVAQLKAAAEKKGKGATP